MTLDYQKTWSSMNSLEMVTSKVCSAREILDSAIDALESGNREKAEKLMYAADEFLQYYLEDFDRKFKVAWKETVCEVKTQEDDAAFNGWDGDTSQMPWAEQHPYLANDLLTQNRNSNFPNENTVNSVEYTKAKIETNSPYNDGWTKEYYQNIVDKYDTAAKQHPYLANDLLTQDRNSNFPAENTICDKDDKSPECQKSWNDLWEENYYPEEYQGSTVSSVKQDKVVRWRLPVGEVENGDTGEQEYFITFPEDLLEAANLKAGDEIMWVDNKDGSFALKKLEKPLNHDEMLAAGWIMTDDGFWIKE